MRRRLGKPQLAADGPTGLAPMTVVVVMVGALLWLSRFGAETIYADCDYATFWVSGWFEWTSLFHLATVLVAALATLFIAHLLTADARQRWHEALMQALVIFALGLWLLSLKAYLFPFATPSAAQYAIIMNKFYPIEDYFLVDEGFTPSIWSEQQLASGPPPPEIEFWDKPMHDPKINKRLPEIFTSKYSPTGADMERLKQCVAEQRRAMAQWKKDRAAIDAWYDTREFRMEIKRPPDWREEIEAEQQGFEE